MKIYNIVWILIAVSIVLSCNKVEQGISEPVVEAVETVSSSSIEISKKQFEANKMQLIGLEAQPFHKQLAVTGVTAVPPQHKGVVGASIGGYIASMPLNVGNYVRKGAVVVTVSNPEFILIQKNYAEISQQLTYLDAELQRHQAMFEEKVVPKKDYLKAESDYNTAKATHNALQKQLQLLNISPAKVAAGELVSTVAIYAPISGNITKINVVQGSYINPSDVILEIVDNSYLYLQLEVFEKEIMQLEEGQEVVFSIPENSDKTYKGKIKSIGKEVGENRTAQVYVEIDKKQENRLLSGMFVHASILVRQAMEKALPETAFVQNDKTYVGLLLVNQTADTYYFDKVELTTESPISNHFLAIKNSTTFGDNPQFLNSNIFDLIGE